MMRIIEIITENSVDPGQPITFPKGTTVVDVSDPYDWYKLGMTISDLDDANPATFGKGGPSTVIAFGSEEEEHRLLPHLKRLGLKLHDIDRPEDIKKAIPAKSLIHKFESMEETSNLKEKLNRTGSKELVIFDIDDTLLHTTAQIKVINKKTGQEKSLTNQQFNNYKLQPDEEFDFGEFRNARKFEEESVPIGPMLDKLRADLNAGKNVVMLTARADFDDQPAVYRTFKRHGIDINKDVHLYRAGNLPGDESPATKKAIHVSKWLSTGNFNKITMYDDSEKNLYAFKFLEKKFPDVEFQAHHVSDKGETKQVEERRKNKRRHAAYGPGPYGWYGINVDYSGDGGGDGGVGENFADGKNPGRKGLAKRSGVPTKASVSRLRQIAKSSSGEKQRMAHWLANMKAGKKK